MRIKVSDIVDPLTIDVEGDEAWLGKIYESFGVDKGQKSATVSGSLMIFPEQAGVVLVRGKVEFTPPVDCSRCGKIIPWPISESIEVAYTTKSEKNESGPHAIVDLRPQDLDEYLVENDEIDIEVLINEFIQVAVPTRKVLTDEDDRCKICGEDLAGDSVYGQENESEPTDNPFAKLKGLKLKN